MENTNQPDILTPQDSLEGTPQQHTPYQPTTATVGSNTQPIVDSNDLEVPQTVANQQPSQPTDSVVETNPEEVAQRPSVFKNRLFRKVALVSAILLAIIGILTGITFATKKLSNQSSGQSEGISRIKEQSVTIKNKLPADTTSKLNLRVGVFTLSVDGDIAVSGQLRLVSGANSAQLSTSNLTANQTYALPNTSGTICLDANNCNFATSAQLTALQDTGLGAPLIGGMGITVNGQVITNSGVLSVNGQTGALNLQGTPNQLIITAADGTISLALPQDIGLTSTPQFGGVVLTSVGTQNGFNLCDSSNNCNYAGGANTLLQGGNNFGSGVDVVMGATNNAGITLITNNTGRFNISNNGLITLGGATTDRLAVTAQLIGNRPLVFQGVTDDFFSTSLVIAEPNSNRNIILPNLDGTICLTSGNCSGAGGYGDVLNGGNNVSSPMSVGTTNLFSLALKTNDVNRITISSTGVTTLFGNVTATADVILGSSSSNRITINSQILGGVPFVFQGPTDNGFATSFVVTDPTANHVITIPDLDGTLCLTSGNCAGVGGSGDILNNGNTGIGDISIGANDSFGVALRTSGTNRLTITNVGAATFSGNLTVEGSTVLGNSSTMRLTVNSQILGGVPFVFQGATDNAFSTSLILSDPTANRTITIPNLDGTICLNSGNCVPGGGGYGDVLQNGNNFIATMVIGTNDDFGLRFKTNLVERITISNTGLTTVLGNFVVNGDTLLGASSANAVTIQATNFFVPNDLNIDSYTQYIDSINNQVGFGLMPTGSARVQILATNGGDGLTVNNGTSAGNIVNLQDNGTNVFTVANGGSVTSRNSVDSTTALQVQNFAGVNLFQIDSFNSTLYVGNSTPDSLGALLVLDTKNTTGDPTGINGAMYYNSFLNKFRCFENSTWGDCSGTAAGDILQNGNNNFSEDITIGALNVFGLNLITNGTTRLNITDAGNATLTGGTTGVALTVNNSTSTGNILNLQDNGTDVMTISDGGAALFKNFANSPSAFQIQNATGTTLLNANTASNLISIGNGVSATPTLLVLGNSNNASDPTGYDGATYYNVALNKFRCYENSGWKNCITVGGGGPGAGDINNGGNTGYGNISIGNLDNARLDLITFGQTRIKITGGGHVAINSTSASLGTVETFRVNTPTTVDNATSSIISSTGLNNKVLVIQGAASQTANLQEWQTSTGQLRAAVLASGEFRIYDTTGTDATRFTPGASGSLTVNTTNEGNLTLNPGGALNLGTGSTNAVVIGRGTSDGGIIVRGATTMNATASTIALTVRGVTSQTAHLQEWQAVGGTLLASVNSSGYFSINNGALLDRFNSQSRISAASGTGLYVTDSSGNGLYVASGGNVGINNASTANKLSINTPTTADSLAQLLIATNATTNKGLVIQGAASQTANFIEVQSNLGTALASITASGGVRATGGSASVMAYAFTGDNNTGFFTPGSGQVGVSSNGTEVARWTSKGLEVGSTGTQGTVEKFRVNTPTTIDNTAISIISTGATTNKALVLQRVTSQTANIFEVQTGAGALLAGITSAGDLVFGQGSAHSISIAAATTVNANGSALTVQAGQANGTGIGGDLNLYGGFPGAGSISGGGVNIVGAGGFITGGNVNITAGIGGVNQGVVNIQSGSNGAASYGANNINAAGGRVNVGAALNAAKLSIVNDTNTTADTVLVVRGAASQTGSIQQWQATSGTVLASIDASGNMTLASGSLDITAGSLKISGTDRISNSGTLLNVTYNGNTIGAAYGGTGATTLTANGILFGNGTGAIQATVAGNSGQCLVANTGLSPSWAACAAGGSGDVNQGGNDYGTEMTIGTTTDFGINLIVDNHAALRFSDSSQATFQNQNDSPTAFQVQNALGTSLFNIDSANNRIYVGNATPDSIGTVLVLDTKNTSGDPTGVDGAMYYNSNLGKFRCYENSEWKDCIYNMKTASKSADQVFGSTSYAGVNDLSFSVVANKAYRLQCSLLVSVPNGTNGGNVSTTGPASPSQYTATFLKSLDQSGGDNYATSSSFDDGSLATTFKVNTISTSSNRFIVNYNAVLVNGSSAGTWQLRAKAFANDGSSITFYANSSCNMQPL